METWLNIPGYENYQVSNLGRVRSMINKYQKLQITRFGYLRATLYRNNISKKIMVHRLVATVFIRNPLNKPEVNHINGIKTDNRAENLEWVTKSENIRHSFRIGRTGLFGSSNPKAKAVINIVTKETWDCAVDCAKANNINYNTLRNQLNEQSNNNTNFQYLTKTQNHVFINSQAVRT